jgi:hypothetical protein
VEEEETGAAPDPADDLPFASEMLEEEGQESGAMVDQGEVHVVLWVLFWVL